MPEKRRKETQDTDGHWNHVISPLESSLSPLLKSCDPPVRSGERERGRDTN